MIVVMHALHVSRCLFSSHWCLKVVKPVFYLPPRNAQRSTLFIVGMFVGARSLAENMPVSKLLWQFFRVLVWYVAYARRHAFFLRSWYPNRHPVTPPPPAESASGDPKTDGALGDDGSNDGASPNDASPASTAGAGAGAATAKELKTAEERDVAGKLQQEAVRRCTLQIDRSIDR